ncbi:DUF6387 family protein [Burkholderia multivorans]|uniref:DUF6387 family protein n=1 Tax=Burkholderia multivorans TaxID=87883 RepID=UPI001C22708A|nr:DUF6387 family protein [Burkholderia multivorans]MBU9440328.1 hypothetical protein [Burkholderia multivorans]
MEKEARFQLSDLPSSFDISKYDACAAFGIGDWYNNLMYRALRKSMFENHKDYYYDELNKSVEYLLINPIVPTRKIRDGDGFSKNVFRSQVRDQTAMELLFGGWSLEVYGDRAQKYIDAHAIIQEDMNGETKNSNYDAAKNAHEVLDVPAWKMLTDLGVDLSGEVAVNVDLFSSEEKLVADFKAWLRATRTALNVPDLKGRFDQSDFDRWHRNRILAYLDITLWGKVKGARLTNQIIGVALFPNEYNVSLAERIRKTVAPEALAAYSTPYLEALMSQALSESE